MKRMLSGVLTITAAMLAPLGAPVTLRAEPPKILQFRVQEVNQKTYFHLRVQQPADLASDVQGGNRRWDAWSNPLGTDPSQRPRLAPQDGVARLVYLREAVLERWGASKRPRFRGQHARLLRRLHRQEAGGVSPDLSEGPAGARREEEADAA